jgi:hypothetical protein
MYTQVCSACNAAKDTALSAPATPAPASAAHTHVPAQSAQPVTPAPVFFQKKNPRLCMFWFFGGVEFLYCLRERECVC